jgi:hypothetical protein
MTFYTKYIGGEKMVFTIKIALNRSKKNCMTLRNKELFTQGQVPAMPETHNYSKVHI